MRTESDFVFNFAALPSESTDRRRRLTTHSERQTDNTLFLLPQECIQTFILFFTSTATLNIVFAFCLCSKVFFPSRGQQAEKKYLKTFPEIFFWIQSRKNISSLFLSFPFVDSDGCLLLVWFYFRFLKIADVEKCIHTRNLSFFYFYFANHYRCERKFLPPAKLNHPNDETLSLHNPAIITDPIERRKPSSDRSERFWKYIYFFLSFSATTTSQNVYKQHHDTRNTKVGMNETRSNIISVTQTVWERVSVASPRLRDHEHSCIENSRLCVAAPIHAAPINNEGISSPLRLLLNLWRHKYSDTWVIRTLIDRDPILCQRISLAFNPII